MDVAWLPLEDVPISKRLVGALDGVEDMAEALLDVDVAQDVDRDVDKLLLLPLK